MGALLITNVALVAFFMGGLKQEVKGVKEYGKENKAAIQRVDDKLMRHLEDPTRRWTNGDFD